MNKNEKTTHCYSIDTFCSIMKTLRGEYGCPWDQKQTHASLKQSMLEEAAEAVSAIKYYEKTNQPEALREELGDVLLQVVMHAQIAEEEGLFTFDDVIEEVSQKMLRRHPHVFKPDGLPLNGEKPLPENLQSWSQIKEIENQGKTYHETKFKKGIRKKLIQIVQFFL